MIKKMYYYVAIKCLNPWFILTLHFLICIILNYYCNNLNDKQEFIMALTAKEEIYIRKYTSYLKEICISTIKNYIYNKEYLQELDIDYKTKLKDYFNIWTNENNLQKYIEKYEWHLVIADNYNKRTKEELTQIINEFFYNYILNCEEFFNETKKEAFKYLLDYAQKQTNSAYRASQIASPEFINKVIETFPWARLINTDYFVENKEQLLVNYYLQCKLNTKYDLVQASIYNTIMILKPIFDKLDVVQPIFKIINNNILKDTFTDLMDPVSQIMFFSYFIVFFGYQELPYFILTTFFPQKVSLIVQTVLLNTPGVVIQMTPLEFNDLILSLSQILLEKENALKLLLIDLNDIPYLR